jgi:isopentenyl phosphate kinase
MQELVLLKLGGSLITDKTQAYTARHEDKLADLALKFSARFNRTRSCVSFWDMAPGLSGM